MKRQRLVLLLFITFCCLTILIPGGTTAADKVFKLGIMAPMTGPSGKSGTDIKNGATMAIEKAGNKVGDYKIELVYIDDQSDPVKATSALSEAIERQGVQAVIMNWNTSVTIATMDVFAKYKVPFFFAIGCSQSVNEKWNAQPPSDRYLIIKGWPMPQKMVTGYVDCLNNAIEKGLWKPTKKLVAFYGEDNDWGRNVAQGMRAGMKAKGWEVFTEEYFAATQTDFYPFLNKCKQAGVTAVMGSSTGVASTAALVKQAKEVGLKAVLAADGMGWAGDWYKLMGPASDGVLDMIQQIATPGQKAFAEEYKKKYGSEPSPSAAGHAYDYANYILKIAKTAIKKTGKLDSKSLFKIGVEEVQTGKLTYSAADGALFQKKYGTTPQVVPDPKIGPDDFYLPVIQYNGGVGKIVFPESEKQTDMTFN